MNKPHIIVVDLDGTLCNSGHREHLARADQWDEFHALLGDDEPWPDVAQLVDRPFHGDFVNFKFVALTARNERYRNATLKWLEKHDLQFDELLMRPDDNYESTVDVKPMLLNRWLDEERLTHADVWFILEDRDKMVEAWRNLGHNCWQTRPGGY